MYLYIRGCKNTSASYGTPYNASGRTNTIERVAYLNSECAHLSQEDDYYRVEDLSLIPYAFAQKLKIEETPYILIGNQLVKLTDLNMLSNPETSALVYSITTPYLGTINRILENLSGDLLREFLNPPLDKFRKTALFNPPKPLEDLLNAEDDEEMSYESIAWGGAELANGRTEIETDGPCHMWVVDRFGGAGPIKRFLNWLRPALYRVPKEQHEHYYHWVDFVVNRSFVAPVYLSKGDPAGLVEKGVDVDTRYSTSDVMHALQVLRGGHEYPCRSWMFHELTKAGFSEPTALLMGFTIFPQGGNYTEHRFTPETQKYEIYYAHGHSPYDGGVRLHRALALFRGHLPLSNPEDRDPEIDEEFSIWSTSYDRFDKKYPDFEDKDQESAIQWFRNFFPDRNGFGATSRVEWPVVLEMAKKLEEMEI